MYFSFVVLPYNESEREGQTSLNSLGGCPHTDNSSSGLRTLVRSMGWGEGRTEPICALGWTRQHRSAVKGGTDMDVAHTEITLSVRGRKIMTSFP